MEIKSKTKKWYGKTVKRYGISMSKYLATERKWKESEWMSSFYEMISDQNWLLSNYFVIVQLLLYKTSFY